MVIIFAIFLTTVLANGQEKYINLLPYEEKLTTTAIRDGINITKDSNKTDRQTGTQEETDHVEPKNDAASNDEAEKSSKFFTHDKSITYSITDTSYKSVDKAPTQYTDEVNTATTENYRAVIINMPKEHLETAIVNASTPRKIKEEINLTDTNSMNFIKSDSVTNTNKTKIHKERRNIYQMSKEKFIRARYVNKKQKVIPERPRPPPPSDIEEPIGFPSEETNSSESDSKCIKYNLSKKKLPSELSSKERLHYICKLYRGKTTPKKSITKTIDGTNDDRWLKLSRKRKKKRTILRARPEKTRNTQTITKAGTKRSDNTKKGNKKRNVLSALPNFNLPDSSEALNPYNAMENGDKTHYAAIKDILSRNVLPVIDSKERDEYIRNLYKGKPIRNITKKPISSQLKDSLRSHETKRKRGILKKLYKILKSMNRYFIKLDEEIIDTLPSIIDQTNQSTNKTLNYGKGNTPKNGKQVINEKNVYKNDKTKIAIFMNVLKGLMLEDSEALKQYDWLATTVQIQSALSKMFETINRIKESKPIHPADLQILKYAAFLHYFSLELKEVNKLDNKLEKRAKLLPRNKNKRNSKLLKEKGLIHRVWLRMMLPDLIAKDRISYLNEFLIDVQDALFDLHEAIRHIADVTKFKHQNWYSNLRELYLSTDEKHLRELLLHISMSRLVDLLGHSLKDELDNDIIHFVKLHKKEAKRTVEEMLFINKIVNEIKINKV